MAEFSGANHDKVKKLENGMLPQTSTTSDSKSATTEKNAHHPSETPSSLAALDDSIPSTRVLIPRERIPVPAKKPGDQPLVTYEIDSDEDELHTFRRISVPGDLEAKSQLLKDGFDIDLDDDSGSDDLDLIPPKTLPKRFTWCRHYSCALQ